MAKELIIVNENKRIVKINGVRLNVGANIITLAQYEKMKASPHFTNYFDDEIEKMDSDKAAKCVDRLTFKKGFGPDDMNDKNKNLSAIDGLLALSDPDFKKEIQNIFDHSILKDLEARPMKGAKLTAIQSQLKKVTPTADEMKK